MKYWLLVIVFLFSSSLARGQAGQATEIKSGPTNPTTCNPARGWLFWNTTTNQMNTCSSTNTWTAPSAGSGSNGIFNISTTCGGATNCLQWVDDDSTDNCGAATTAFLTLINAYSGPGVAELYVGGSGPGKAYKLNSCSLVFTKPRTMYLWATIDCGPGIVSANCIQEGPSGLVAFANAQTLPYTIDGTGAIVGCLNVTVACIEAEPYISNPRIRNIHLVNVGAGNASPPACTNYAMSFDGPNNAPQIIGTENWNTDSTTGRCWSINNRLATSIGSNTGLIAHNTVIGAGAATTFLTPCGSVGHSELGAATIITDNQFYGYGEPIVLVNPQTNTTVSRNLIDQAGCTTGVASADVHFGNASNGTVTGVNFMDNFFPGGAGHATNAASVASGSTSALVDVAFINNRTSHGAGKLLMPIASGCTGTCFAYANTAFALPTFNSASAWNAGTAALPIYPVGNSGNGGWYSSSTNAGDFSSGGVDVFEIGGGSSGFAWIMHPNGLAIGAASNSWVSAPSSGVFDLGIGAQTTTGKLQASGLISEGTKFTTNNGCTDGANTGGATAGYFVVGSTSCTEVITMGDSATAPHGWSCTTVDITTLGDVTNPHQTTSNGTTATIVTGTVVSGDKIQFSCIGY